MRAHADELSMQKLVCWLEDAHIRRWSVAERAQLRCTPFAPALDAYSTALSLPDDCEKDVSIAVQYLLDVALSLYFEDCADMFNRPIDPWAGRVVPEVKGASGDADVHRAAHELLSALNVDSAELSAADAVHVAADIAEERLAHDAPQPPREDSANNMDGLPLGFATGDPLVDRVATVMRLLHVAELRKFQNTINEVIANMQSVTANPKTNVRQGKVGR